ncbi:MAG: hypothetical protein Unbinned2990contig1001_11 [Prokaryotic dsDNA virus sp.]|nr:MAG: hypothetical protein Unbinned2990contig1001_11 [Prokaryotic dsDNA virus sp.]
MEIKGNPKPQQRHRNSRWGIYDPSKKDKQDFLKKAHKDYNPYSPNSVKHLPRLEAINLNIKFYMKRPKSHYRTGKYADQVKEKWITLPHTKKPDIDNLVKFVMDSLSGINGFFLDDNQIVSVFAEKIYSDKPRTEIMIVDIDEEKN